jgi:hypothetical protein
VAFLERLFDSDVSCILKVGYWGPAAPASACNLLGCKFSNLTTHLNQKLCDWGLLICILTNPPGDSNAWRSLRTIGSSNKKIQKTIGLLEDGYSFLS